VARAGSFVRIPERREVSVVAKTETLRVALAGAGMISRHHLLAWQALHPDVEMVGIFDPDERRAARRAEEFGVRAFYGEPAAMLDAVRPAVLDIASPRETHAAWAMAAAERGIAVLCQKPMAPTLAEADVLVRGIGGRVRMMVHENWRWRPWYRTVRGWLDAGELGEILAFDLSMFSSGLLPDAAGRRPALERQPFMQAEKRLMIAEVLIHHLDVARFLCGSLRVVGARTERTLPDVVGETLAAIFLETAKGAPVAVAGSMATPGFPPATADRLQIVGSRASVVLADGMLRLLGPTPRTEPLDFSAGYQASFDATIRHFVECLASGEQFETDPMDNLETLRLVEHAYWASGPHADDGEAGR
jgi:D-apiose dehydrogenase